ncbi:hypothetical protein M0P48_05170 [Candidatus Gracilibacteria bacterium]|nr:hypothetical protein [Candidatus Gracilibacteria bacterium]
MSEYTGSEATRLMVEEQIKAKYGVSEIKNLDCYHNMRTFKSWANLGFKIRRGEHAFKSITYVEQKDPSGNVIKKYRRPVSLFYYRQIEPITSNKSVGRK